MGQQILEVPVSGGSLVVTAVGSSLDGAPVVVLLHGLTGSHKIWQLVTSRLDHSVRYITLDFRGRGENVEMSGPWGLEQHVADIAAVLDYFDVSNALLVGYSMGGFVATRIAELRPDTVSSIVLIEGGVMASVPLGSTPAEALQAFLGPTWECITGVYRSRLDYLHAWRSHPALRSSSQAIIDGYASYSAAGTSPRIRSRLQIEALYADANDLFSDSHATTSLARIAHPVELLRTSRGPHDTLHPVVASQTAAEYCQVKTNLTVLTVPGVNHLTILLSAKGTDAVLASVQRQLLNGQQP